MKRWSSYRLAIRRERDSSISELPSAYCLSQLHVYPYFFLLVIRRLRHDRSDLHLECSEPDSRAHFGVLLRHEDRHRQWHVLLFDYPIPRGGLSWSQCRSHRRSYRWFRIDNMTSHAVHQRLVWLDHASGSREVAAFHFDRRCRLLCESACTQAHEHKNGCKTFHGVTLQ